MNKYLRTSLMGLCVSGLAVSCSQGGRGPLAAAPPTEIPPPSCSAKIAKQHGAHWMSAWGGTRTTGTAPADATIRNITRVTASGDSIRLRFFNLNPDTPITIGAVAVGIRDGDVGANLVPGSNQQVTFECGQTGITIPPNTGSLYSDEIPITVANQDDLAVSLYVEGASNAGEFSTEWNYSYVAANGTGDLTAEESGAQFPSTSNTVFALRDVEVLTTETNGAMTFLGSSSLHGSNSTRNSYLRVGDQLSRRILAEIPDGERKAVVNRGIGGDSLGNAWNSRMEQDIWSTTGVDSVVVWVTNDLATRSADAIIADYLALIDAAHERAINVICPTWVPGAQSSAANFNGDRDALNDWILNSGNCDAVVDWGSMVEDQTGTSWNPTYLSDGIHTNDAGHTLWSDNTDIVEWVTLPPPAPAAR